MKDINTLYSILHEFLWGLIDKKKVELFKTGTFFIKLELLFQGLCF